MEPGGQVWGMSLWCPLLVTSIAPGCAMVLWHCIPVLPNQSGLLADLSVAEKLREGSLLGKSELNLGYGYLAACEIFLRT